MAEFLGSKRETDVPKPPEPAFGRSVRCRSLATGRAQPSIAINDLSAYRVLRPTRRDRGVASIAYAQKISADWSIPIGATWANQEEFIGDVQKKLSAHLGLSYKLPWKN